VSIESHVHVEGCRLDVHVESSVIPPPVGATVAEDIVIPEMVPETQEITVMRGKAPVASFSGLKAGTEYKVRVTRTRFNESLTF